VSDCRCNAPLPVTVIVRSVAFWAWAACMQAIAKIRARTLRAILMAVGSSEVCRTDALAPAGHLHVLR